jgi:hypothetical protein
VQEKKRQMADFKERAARSRSEQERRLLLWQVGRALGRHTHTAQLKVD